MPSSSWEWAAPTFFVCKPNSALRMVTDFWQLGKVTIRHPYLLLKMEDIFGQLDGFNFMSVMDLSDGFYHVGLSNCAKRFFTIVVLWGEYQYKCLPQGEYQYKCLPQGLKISPGIFQHKMD
jgi:hypothetical protein